MLKGIGALLLCAVAAIVCVAYAKYERRRLAQTEGFLLLVREIRGQIACFAPPIPVVAAGFDHAALARCGFLPAFRRSGDFAASLRESEGALAVGEETERALVQFASALGRSYREEQLALCDRTAARLEEAVAREKEEIPRRIRMGDSLIVCASLGLILLLL